MTAEPIPSDAYERIDAMNWSTLKYLDTSAKLMRRRIDVPRSDTVALGRGRALHCAVLEPERWVSDYVVAPDVNLSTRAGKAVRAAWLLETARRAGLAPDTMVAKPDMGDGRTKAGKEARAAWEEGLAHDAIVLEGNEDAAEILGDAIEVIDASEHALVEHCAAEVRAHSRAMRLLRGGRAEESTTWVDEETGVKCKGRLDWVTPRYILDVKTTRQVTLRAIAADFARFLYHGQLAWYHEGAIAAGLLPPDAELPYSVIVQTVEPFDVIPAQLSELDFERGRRLFRSLLRRYVDCRSTKWWPGLAPDLIELELPEWAPSGFGQSHEEDW